MMRTMIFASALSIGACPAESDDGDVGDGGAAAGAGANGSANLPECDIQDPSFANASNDCEFILLDDAGSEVVSGTCDRFAVASDAIGMVEGEEERIAEIQFASGRVADPSNRLSDPTLMNFTVTWGDGSRMSDLEGFKYALGAADNPTFASDALFRMGAQLSHNPSGPIPPGTFEAGHIAVDLGAYSSENPDSLALQIDSVVPFCRVPGPADRTIYDVHGTLEGMESDSLVFIDGSVANATKATYSLKITF